MKKTALFATLLCLAQSSLHAVVPQLLNYQGKVFDSAGMPLGATGSVTAPVASPINRKIIFRIYAAATGGSTIWTEEQTATISLGEFSVVLGTGSQVSGNVPLSTVFADGTDRYLEIVVDNGDGSFGASDLPINPRQQITSTGFAFHARYADEITSTANMTVNTSTGAVSAKAITATSVNVSGGGAITGTHVGDGAQLTALAGANITAGTVPSAALVAAVQQALCPPGTVVAYMGATAPAGWLLCDGRQYSRNPPYDKLYAVMGNASGSADTNHFNVPDFRGRFLRGWDNGIGRDVDRAARTAMAVGGNTGDAIGSIQTDAFRNHTHTFSDTYTNFSQTSASGREGNTGATGTVEQADTTGNSSTGGNETRPINANVNYIIKL